MGVEAVVSQDTPGRYVIKLAGDLAYPTSDELVATVARVVADSGTVNVVVDLSGVRFLDSSGVESLMRARSTTLAASGSLSVTGAAGTVAEVLRITAVDGVLSVEG